MSRERARFNPRRQAPLEDDHLADKPTDPRKASSFNRLKAVADGIKEQITVQRSLTVARMRQQFMLPRLPEVRGYEFAFVYIPAEHVSGDFCDIIDLGQGRYGILVGDISGHGMEAGIVMGAARKALQIYVRQSESPVQAMSLANDDLRRDLDRQTFLTASYAELNIGTGSVRYVRAGHNPPLLIGPRDQCREVQSGGTSIGVTKGEHFTRLLEEKRFTLQSGQTFVQFTDGVVEAHDRSGEEFGTRRLVAFLQESLGGDQPLGEILEGLHSKLKDWVAGAAQEDDVTLLAVRRTV
jgi:sigma-B regulation protein RsbU (phosphoserine phosphatase)